MGGRERIVALISGLLIFSPLLFPPPLILTFLSTSYSTLPGIFLAGWLGVRMYVQKTWQGAGTAEKSIITLGGNSCESDSSRRHLTEAKAHAHPHTGQGAIWCPKG